MLRLDYNYPKSIEGMLMNRKIHISQEDQKQNFIEEKFLSLLEDNEDYLIEALESMFFDHEEEFNQKIKEAIIIAIEKNIRIPFINFIKADLSEITLDEAIEHLWDHDTDWRLLRSLITKENSKDFEGIYWFFWENAWDVYGEQKFGG